MNLFEAGYALGVSLVEGESQLYHKFGISPESRHKRQRHGWNLYGGKFDDANEVNAYDRHMDERKKAARHAGKFGAVVGGIAGAGLAHRYGTPLLRAVATNRTRNIAGNVRGGRNRQVERIGDLLSQDANIFRPDSPEISVADALRHRNATSDVVAARRAAAKTASADYRRGVGKLAPFVRKHAGKLAVGAGLGLGALALGGAAYMKTRWSKDKRAHTYDAKTRSYKPVA